MQEASEAGKYVTDGKHVYPYNAFLDEMLANGTLKFCERPAAAPQRVAETPMRSPVTMSPDERADLAARLGISVGDLTNMSAQELQEAEAGLAAEAALNSGFTTA